MRSYSGPLTFAKRSARPLNVQAWSAPDLFDPLKKEPSASGLRQVKRVFIFIIGMTVLLFGVALIVLPGPAFLVIPAGLAILGIEFEWARRRLRALRGLFDRIAKQKNSGVKKK